MLPLMKTQITETTLTLVADAVVPVLVEDLDLEEVEENTKVVDMETDAMKEMKYITLITIMMTKKEYLNKMIVIIIILVIIILINNLIHIHLLFLAIVYLMLSIQKITPSIL